MLNFNGWLIINKPVGISSNFVLTKLKRYLPKKIKIGHAGTLDPLAEGVLPVAVGEATKTVQYLMDANKEYEFDVSWGVATATADKEGEVINSGGKIPTLAEIHLALPKLVGEIMQKPPIYSALKINGQPAYKLARQGVEIDLAPRKVLIEKLEVVAHDNFVTRLRVSCGKGTYVRSIAVDLADILETFAHVTYLKRTKVGKFLLADAIMLEKLLEIVHNNEADWQLFPVDYGLGDILALEVNADQAKALRNGLSIYLPDYSDEIFMLAQVKHKNILQGLVNISKGIAKPLRIFNL
jgi:tRNA pseudouridine55 synthase